MRSHFATRAAVVVLTLLATLPMAAPLGAAAERVVVAVEGMACPFCAYGVEKRLRTVAGVTSIDVDM